jgi:hypothetical protein
MRKDPTYKDYVKKDRIKDFKKMCFKNSLDFYSAGVITTAHMIMYDLMRHRFKKPWRSFQGKKISCKEAHDSAFNSMQFHSGCSASCVDFIVENYSPRGLEYKRWKKRTDDEMHKQIEKELAEEEKQRKKLPAPMIESTSSKSHDKARKSRRGGVRLG